MLIGAVLSLSAIHADTIWTDEAVTAHVVTTRAGPFVDHLLFTEPSAAVYYLLLRPWVAVFGSGEAGLRSFSAASTVAAVPFIYLIGLRVFGRAAAFAAALIFVVNSFVLAYAVEARAYALALLFVAAATWLLMRAVTHGTRGSWILYSAAMLAAVYVHFYSFFVAVAYAIWVLMCHRTRAAMIATGSILLASVPMGLVLLVWGPPRNWIDPPTLKTVLNVLQVSVGGTPGDPWSAVLALAFLGAILAMALRAWRRWPNSETELLLLSAVALPIAFGLLISLVKPIFIARSLLVLVPSLVVAMGGALALVRPRPLAIVLVALLVGLSVHETNTRGAGKSDWRSAISSIASRANAGDAVLVYPPGLAWNAARYYLVRDPRTDETRILNAEAPAGRVHRLIREDQARHERVWLLIPDGDLRDRARGLDRVLRVLRRYYEIGDTTDFHRLQVVLFERGSRRE
jgi:mannosyltransferase